MYLFPCGDLLGVPYPWHVRIPAGLGRDYIGFRDEERARRACALGIVFFDERQWNAVGGDPVARERRENDAMFQREVADADGLEELGRGSRLIVRHV